MSNETQEQVQDEGELVAARRAKLAWLRDEMGIDPFGHRVDGIMSLAHARSLYDAAADDAHAASVAANKEEHQPEEGEAAVNVNVRLLGGHSMPFIPV